MSTENVEKTVEVTLEKTHTHAGESHSQGAKIQVTESEKSWLEAQGVIKTNEKKESK